MAITLTRYYTLSLSPSQPRLWTLILLASVRITCSCAPTAYIYEDPLHLLSVAIIHP